MEKLYPSIFNLLKTPSLLGGSTQYDGQYKKAAYPTRYLQYLRKYQRIPFKIYSDNVDKRVLFHFMMPSMKEPNVIYDVILEFYAKNQNQRQEETLMNYDMRFFSNTPGFVFTYVYVFHKSHHFVEEMVGKVGESALHTPPNKTNPNQAHGFDFYTWAAMNYLCSNKFYLVKELVRRRKRSISHLNEIEILHADDVLDKRSPQQLIPIKKIERELDRRVLKPLKQMKDRISSSIFTAKKPIKATKARKATKPKRPRKPQ